MLLHQELQGEHPSYGNFSYERFSKAAPAFQRVVSCSSAATGAINCTGLTLSEIRLHAALANPGKC